MYNVCTMYKQYNVYLPLPGESDCVGASSDSVDSSSFFKPRSLGGRPITERSLIALEHMSSMDSHNKEYLQSVWIHVHNGRCIIVHVCVQYVKYCEH